MSCERISLLGQGLLVALVVVAVELLLQPLDALVDVLVAHLDAHLFGFLRELGALEEERDRLRLELFVLEAPGLGEGTLLRRVGLLGAVHERVELLLRHLLRAGDGDIVRAELCGRFASAAACGDERERKKRVKGVPSHAKSAICSGFLTLPGARPV